MEKRVFNKITKELFLNYGFSKEKNIYILSLKDVTIVVKFRSWRGVKSFDYYFYINALYDDSVSFEKKYDSVVEIHMEHSPFEKGYHAHEILYEKYDEVEYEELLNGMLHTYFDPFKENALKYLKESDIRFYLTKKAKEFLGVI